jgi:hypothetical protein
VAVLQPVVVAARVAAVVAVSAPEGVAVAQPSRGLPEEAVAVVDFAPVVAAEAAPSIVAVVVAVADTPIAAAATAAAEVTIAAVVDSFPARSQAR